MIPIACSLVLFAIGVYGALTRRDILRIFISVTIMLSSVTVLLVALLQSPMTYSMVLLIWAVEVTEVIVSVAIFLYLSRKGLLDIGRLEEFKW